QDFPDDVEELMKYFSLENKRGRVRAILDEGLDIPVWILGSSLFSAVLSAKMGLPYAFASHYALIYLEEALARYCRNFQPSEYLKAPYVMACVYVMAADTDKEAEFLATSFYQLALGMIRGTRNPLPPPVENMENHWMPHEAAAVQQMMSYTFVGGPQSIQVGLQVFVDQHQLDEVMIVSHIYDHEARLRSYGIVADVF